MVLGIFPNAAFPLARERAFQMSDGGTRLFAMPYTRDLSMWQLSWEMPEDEALALGRCARSLKAKALEVCRGWHAPVPAMIEASDFHEFVSGSVLVARVSERDRQAVRQK